MREWDSASSLAHRHPKGIPKGIQEHFRKSGTSSRPQNHIRDVKLWCPLFCSLCDFWSVGAASEGSPKSLRIRLGKKAIDLTKLTRYGLSRALDYLNTGLEEVGEWLNRHARIYQYVEAHFKENCFSYTYLMYSGNMKLVLPSTQTRTYTPTDHTSSPLCPSRFVVQDHQPCILPWYDIARSEFHNLLVPGKAVSSCI